MFRPNIVMVRTDDSNLPFIINSIYRVFEIDTYVYEINLKARFVHCIFPNLTIVEHKLGQTCSNNLDKTHKDT